MCVRGCLWKKRHYNSIYKCVICKAVPKEPKVTV